jgi:predicted GNAT family acetyltransferase
MNSDIRHNENESRFETTVDGSVAFVEYDLEPGSIVFTHTVVPDEISGRGIANQLASHVLNYAREQKLAVVPQCAFIASWIERHPEYRELVRKQA